MIKPANLTVRQLADALDIPARTVRWHCQSPSGLLFGKAVREEYPSGVAWSIPPAAAEDFARDYERHARKNGDQQ